MVDFKKPRNPVPTVDLIIEMGAGRNGPKVIIIKRKNPPLGWALPGGFVDYGESLEAAAVREAREETSLEVELAGQFHAYSDPERDPRLHTVSTVFIARAAGVPRAADDACGVRLVDPEKINVPLVFDHDRIIRDYIIWKKGLDPWRMKTGSRKPRRRRPTSRRFASSSDRSKRT